MCIRDSTLTTPLVQSITQNGQNFSYTYDDVGNIVREVHNGKNTTYVYDSLGQLIRYNDEQAGKSWVFTYDRGGNLTKEQRYAFTEGTLGSMEYYQDFQYGNANWKDQMTRRVHGGSYNYDICLLYTSWKRRCSKGFGRRCISTFSSGCCGKARIGKNVIKP